MRIFALAAVILFSGKFTMAYTPAECAEYCTSSSARCIALGRTDLFEVSRPWADLIKAAMSRRNQPVQSICQRQLILSLPKITLDGASCAIEKPMGETTIRADFPQNLIASANSDHSEITFMEQKPHFQIQNKGDAAPWTAGEVNFLSATRSAFGHDLRWSNGNWCFSAIMVEQ